MKKLYFLFILFSNLFYAQNSEDRRVYLDSLFKETENSDSPYYRIIEDENTNKEEYKFKTFYKSGKVYIEGNTRSNKSILQNGFITTYFENGNRKEEYYSDKGSIAGNQTAWYENGNKKYVKDYFKEKNELISTVRILQFWDINNVQKVIDGNGYFEGEENHCYEKGKLQNGLRIGKWEGVDKRFKIKFEEDYENGKLIKGVSMDSVSNEQSYTSVRESAKPRKGYEHFYKYIGKKFRFTKKTERQSGKIVLSFIVEKNGTISDIKVLKSAGEELDNEAIRLIESYPDWEPGKYRGRIVRVHYTIPITITAEQ
ncbi:TonB family protein [Flavobacterium buctense]|uniref:TonB family protein n=1 Tax=Flavobacterium buctense TaxID=1648146 RepID=A0ABU9DYJ6_9FLAO|nr:energy transducer TonB [Flavobacterium buctense]